MTRPTEEEDQTSSYAAHQDADELRRPPAGGRREEQQAPEEVMIQQGDHSLLRHSELILSLTHNVDASDDDDLDQESDEENEADNENIEQEEEKTAVVVVAKGKTPKTGGKVKTKEETKSRASETEGDPSSRTRGAKSHSSKKTVDEEEEQGNRKESSPEEKSHVAAFKAQSTTATFILSLTENNADDDIDYAGEDTNVQEQRPQDGDISESDESGLMAAAEPTRLAAGGFLEPRIGVFRVRGANIAAVEGQEERVPHGNSNNDIEAPGGEGADIRSSIVGGTDSAPVRASVLDEGTLEQELKDKIFSQVPKAEIHESTPFYRK
jgi:hypothetical protein